MTLANWNTGPLSLGNIQLEFGGSGNIALSEYYAGGAYVAAGTTGYLRGVSTSIPSSGSISIGNFYGASAAAPATTTTTAAPGTTTTTAAPGTTTTTTTTTAPSGLIIPITTSAASGISRHSPPSLLTQHIPGIFPSTGVLQSSGAGGGNGPFWIADQSQTTNHVYRVDDRIPVGFNASTEWPSDSQEFREYFSAVNTAAYDAINARFVRSDQWNLDSYDSKGGTIASRAFGLSNWGIYGAYSNSRLLVTDNDSTLGISDSNLPTRIVGTPYVFLGIHYGSTTTQIAVGTKQGETGLTTAQAISISLYEANGTTLVSTNGGDNPFHTWIPACNAYGFDGTNYVPNVCWEAGVGSGGGIWRSNWVDLGQPGNNESSGNYFVGQLRIRVTSGTPFVLKFQLGHV